MEHLPGHRPTYIKWLLFDSKGFGVDQFNFLYHIHHWWEGGKPSPGRLGPENCDVIGSIAQTNSKLFENFQFKKIYQVSLVVVGVLFWLCHMVCGILVPQLGIDLGLQQWKCGVLIIGLPRDSQGVLFCFRRQIIYLQSRRPGFNPWVGKILWRRE